MVLQVGKIQELNLSIRLITVEISRSKIHKQCKMEHHKNLLSNQDPHYQNLDLKTIILNGLLSHLHSLNNNLDLHLPLSKSH